MDNLHASFDVASFNYFELVDTQFASYVNYNGRTNTDMGIQVQFTEQDWGRIERDWSGWWDGELKRPLIVIEAWDSHSGEPPEQKHIRDIHF